MKKRVPEFTTDAEAESFVETADLTEYDLSRFKPVQFEFQAKSAQLNMRLPQALLEAIKERAVAQGIPYTKLVREALEQFVATQASVPVADEIFAGNLQLKVKSRSFNIEGKSLRFPKNQSLLLELFFMRKGMLLTKEAMLLSLYPDGLDMPEVKIIDVFVCQLRKTLAGAGATCQIATVWGRGYRLLDPKPVQSGMPEEQLTGRIAR